MVDALYETSSEAGPILGALTEGRQELDQSWELLSRARQKSYVYWSSNDPENIYLIGQIRKRFP